MVKKDEGTSEETAESPSFSAMSPSNLSQTPVLFHFWNGDTYMGEFLPARDKQRIVMEGRGVYQTFDGQTYEGIWENDELKGDCRITFPDESEFSGSLHEMIMEGPGKYKFKENVEIIGEFSDNRLVGKVTLVDPNQQMWRGEVKSEDDSVTFFPLHPFWQEVLNLSSKSQLFYGEAEEDNENHSDIF